MRLLIRANKASFQEFQLANSMETPGRNSESPGSESCHGTQLVVIHPWEGKLHPSSSTSQKDLQ